jgi:CHAT domain-containing protein
VLARQKNRGLCASGAKPLVGSLLLLGSFCALGAPSVAPGGVAACQAQLRTTPRAFGPYLCLAGEVARGHGPEVRQLLQSILKRTPEEPRALFYYALIRSLAGERVAEDEYARAAVGFRREQNVTGLVWALTSQVANRCFERLRCDDIAERLLLEAERLAEESNDLQLKRLCQLWWAREALMVDDVGREERALARLDALPGEDPPWLASQVFQTRAHLAGLLHDYQRQYELYRGLLQKNEPGSWQSMQALGGLAGASASLAAQGLFDRAEAEQLLRRALAEEERLAFELGTSDTGALATRIRLALLLGPTDESMELLEQALAGHLSRKGWNYPYLAWWLLARYTIERNPADVDKALTYADAAVSLSGTRATSWEHSRGLLMRAHVLWRSGQRQPAREAGLAALEQMEALRSQQPDLRVRMRYEETLAFAYRLVASSLLDHGGQSAGPSDVADALAVMERLRARSLLETLLRNSGDANLERRSEARARIDRAQGQLLEPKTLPADRIAALSDLHAAEKEEVSLAIGRELTTDQRSVPSLDDVQKALGPDEALVSFQQWRSEAALDAPYERASSWAVVITRGAAQAVRIPDAEVVDTEVKLWLSLLRARDGSDRAGGARLYDQLVRPVLGVLPPGIHQLLVVPDGSLNSIPFDALTDEHGAYLVERLGISVIPSAAIWLELKRRHLAEAGLALAMAEPGATPLSAEALRAALGMRAETLPPLTLAREEAQSAVEAFPSGSVLLVGRDATEQFLKTSDLQPFSLIHLAAHAVVDSAAPERSAILLAPSAGGDGLLGVEEISHLKLAQKTVVLAACNTLAGPVRRAEGVMSLARGFFEAGAQVVVGTLAPVRDSESAALFSAFYRRIAGGNSVRESLQEAKRERIRAGAPAAAWAEVVTLGNDEVFPRSREPHRQWALAGVGVAFSLFLGAAVLVSRRRRRVP